MLHLLLVPMALAKSPQAPTDPHAALCAALRSPKTTAARVTALAPAGEPGRPCTFEEVSWERDGHSDGWIIFGVVTAGVGFLFPDLGASSHPVTYTITLLPLELAVRSGRSDIVTALVTAGADIEAPFAAGGTALLVAVQASVAEGGTPTLAHTLLGLGASAAPLDKHLATTEALAVVTSPLAAELRAHGLPADLTDDMGRSVLYDAADVGNVAAAQALLAAGLHPDVAGHNNDAPLYAAAKNGDVAMVRLLLAAHATPDGTGSGSPLYAAVAGGHTDAARLLLDAHADPSRGDSGRASPLRAAVDRGDLPLVQMLLTAGAKPDGVGSGWDTPLQGAVEQGNVPLIQVLLDAGADPNLGDTPPLVQALLKERIDIADLLVARGAVPGVHLAFDDTLLSVVARANLPAAVEWGLAHGLTADDESGTSALSAAADRGALDALRVLIAHGADPLATRSTYDHPPVAIAARAGNVNATRLLFEALDTPDQAKWRQFLLHDAVETGRVQVAEYLLSKGATLPTAFERMGEGPIHLAAKGEHWDMVDWLKKRGISIDEVDSSQATALRAAIADRYGKGEDELLARGASLTAAGGPTLYALAAANDDLDRMAWLDGHGVPADNVPGNAALAAAVTQNRPNAYQRLIHLGAKPEARLSDGGTLLHLSAGTAGTPLLDVLLSVHLDVNALDTAGMTPLDRAMARDDRDTVRRLLAAGASAQPVAGAAKAPLQSAVDNECNGCLWELLGVGATSTVPVIVPLSDTYAAQMLDASKVPNTLAGTLEDAIATSNRGAAELLVARGAVVTNGHLILAIHSYATDLVPWLLTKSGVPRGADRRAVMREARATGAARTTRRALREARKSTAVEL